MLVLKSKVKIQLELARYNSEEFIGLASLLSPISLYYPNFKEWLYFSFRKEMISGLRSIIVAHDNGKVAGLTLLKNTAKEKKICTFYVLPSYREVGVGSKLMNAATEHLGGKNIKLSVADERNSELYPLLKSNGFTIETKISGYYRKNITEYFYSLK